MAEQPRIIEVRMGNLVFITNQGMLRTYDKITQKFNLSLMPVFSVDRFVMTISTCGGIFVRNLVFDSVVPLALAHMPSSELARKFAGNMSYAQIREHIRKPEFQARVKELEEFIPRAVMSELSAGLNSPIMGPDLLAERVIESMGAQIEVRIFGGMCMEGQRIPDVVGSIEAEFRQRGAQTVIEHSVLDLNRFDKIAVVSPYAVHPSDFVRPSNRMFMDPHTTIQLSASDLDG